MVDPLHRISPHHEKRITSACWRSHTPTPSAVLACFAGRVNTQPRTDNNQGNAWGLCVGLASSELASFEGSAFEWPEPVPRTLLEVLRLVLLTQWHLLLFIVREKHGIWVGPKTQRAKREGKSKFDTRMRTHGSPERRTSYITITSLRFQCRRSTTSGYLAHTQPIMVP